MSFFINDLNIIKNYIAELLKMSDAITLPDGRLVDSLKVAELKKELEVLGLDKNGLKKDLVKRLSEVCFICAFNDTYLHCSR